MASSTTPPIKGNRVEDLSGSLNKLSTEADEVSRRNFRVVIGALAAYVVLMCGFLAAFPVTPKVSLNSSVRDHSSVLSYLPRVLGLQTSTEVPTNALDLLSEKDIWANTMLHCVAFGMFAALGMAEAVSGCIDTDTSRGRMNILTFGVSIIGATCYALMATGMVPVMYSSAPGRVIFPTRLLSWWFTTSLTMYACWNTGNKSYSYLMTNLGCNAAMLAFGSVCSLCTGPIMWASFTVAIGFFFATGYLRHLMFGSAMSDDDVRANRAVLTLKLFMEGICCVFPITWALQFTPISNVLLEGIIITADVAAKAMMPAVQQAVVLAASDRKHAALMRMSLELCSDLQEKEKSKGRFFAAMTHELRTPLDGILSILDSMLSSCSGDLNEKVLKSITTVRDTGNRFKLLLTTILDATTNESSNLRMDFQPVNLSKIVQDVAVLIEPLMRNGTRLALYIPEDLPDFDADPERMSQILFNLLGNAAKFTDQGEVSLTASAEMGAMMRIEIKDSGVGIPSDKQTSIFKAYEQLDNVSGTGKQRLKTGTGLGLFLAKSLVESHGGTISVKSRGSQGHGSTFTILMPLKASAQTKNADLSMFLAPGPEATEPPSVDAEVTTGQSKALQRIPSSTPSIQGRPKSSPGRQISFTASRSGKDVRRPSIALRDNLQLAVKGQMMRESILLDWLNGRKEQAISFMIRTELEDGLSDKEVVIVHEDPINRTIINETLSGCGFMVTMVSSGTEILAQLRERHESYGTQSFPDLILMALDMTDTNGHRAAHAIRDSYPDVVMPIILMTDDHSEKTILDALQNGCTDVCCISPYKPAEVLARVGLQLDTLHEDTVNLESRHYETLLMELLPASAITRLRDGEDLVTDSLDSVTILQAEIVGLSDVVTSMAAGTDVFQAVDSMVKRLDTVLELHGLYKVHMAGNVYMAVAGHEAKSTYDHPARAVRAAMDFIAVANEIQSPFSDGVMSLRIGLHSGPAIAGVVGALNPQYLLYGETVNTAVKVMKSATPQCILVSNSTYASIQELSPITRSTVNSFHRTGIFVKHEDEDMNVWVVECGNFNTAMKPNGMPFGSMICEIRPDDTQGVPERLDSGCERSSHQGSLDAAPKTPGGSDDGKQATSSPDCSTSSDSFVSTPAPVKMRSRDSFSMTKRRNSGLFGCLKPPS